jgi:hypothetical protein
MAFAEPVGPEHPAASVGLGYEMKRLSGVQLLGFSHLQPWLLRRLP